MQRGKHPCLYGYYNAEYRICKEKNEKKYETLHKDNIAKKGIKKL